MSQTLCKALTKRQHAVHEHVYTEGAYVLNVKGNADASQLDLPIRLANYADARVRTNFKHSIYVTY